MAADMAVMASASYNGGHFWLARRGIDASPHIRARRVAASALALLNGGLAVQALYLLALTAAQAAGRDTAPFFGGTAALTRGPALAGSLLTSGLVLRDRIRNGGGR